MDPKKIALLAGALLVAAVSAFMVRNMIGSGAPTASAAPVAAGPEVLVATRPLPVGTIITADNYRWQPWPKELIDNAYYLKTDGELSALPGTVVRTAISAGQPMTKGSLVKPSDRGFLAAALGPGMRAVTVSVSATTGVAGFIFPGDRVDLLLSQSVEGGAGRALKAAETILRNVRVLATDQRTASEDAQGKHEVKTAATVTLEVTPRIAEKIQVAQSIGQLSLALRSLADDTAELDAAIASGQVTVPPGVNPKDKTTIMQIAARPNDGASTFVTGGDVSRFQRRTVPAAVVPTPQTFATPAPATVAAPSAAPATVALAVPRGPTIRVTRGSTVTIVPIGGK